MALRSGGQQLIVATRHMHVKFHERLSSQKFHETYCFGFTPIRLLEIQ